MISGHDVNNSFYCLLGYSNFQNLCLCTTLLNVIVSFRVDIFTFTDTCSMSNTHVWYTAVNLKDACKMGIMKLGYILVPQEFIPKTGLTGDLLSK